jgi:DNA-binding transcriptional LysR family regulator
MQLRHLRYFVAAAEEENFGRASERLHVTRPAVSQIIADLERELGAPVFERLGHGVRLTAAGRALLPELKRIMNDVDGALLLALRVSQGKSGSVSVAYGALTLMHSLFCQAVKSYHRSCPEVTLTLKELQGSELLRALAERRVDGAFLHFGPTRPLPSTGAVAPSSWEVSEYKDVTLDWIAIQRSRVGVVVPADHPFAQRGAVGMAELRSQPLIDAPRSCQSLSHGAIRKLCTDAGFEPRIVQEVESAPALLNLVRARIGVGLAMSGDHFTYPADLRVVPLADPIEPATFAFAWVKQGASPALAKMVEVIQELVLETKNPLEPIPISRARSSGSL